MTVASVFTWDLVDWCSNVRDWKYVSFSSTCPWSITIWHCPPFRTTPSCSMAFKASFFFYLGVCSTSASVAFVENRRPLNLDNWQHCCHSVVSFASLVSQSGQLVLLIRAWTYFRFCWTLQTIKFRRLATLFASCGIPISATCNKTQGCWHGNATTIHTLFLAKEMFHFI